MKTKNYIKLKYRSLFKVKYAYMDTQPYLADQIFINQGQRKSNKVSGHTLSAQRRQDTQTHEPQGLTQ